MLLSYGIPVLEMGLITNYLLMYLKSVYLTYLSFSSVIYIPNMKRYQ